jgi:TRAP transporter 4TM/12TM fusion protein
MPAIDLQDIEDHETGPRHLQGKAGMLVTGLAMLWSVFQLLIAKSWTLNAEVIRSVHLAFAIGLVFLCFPMFRKGRFPKLSPRDRLPWWDTLAAVLAAACALYIVLDRQGLAQRIGAPLTRDLIAGGLLLLFLLEAARRAVGPALPSVAGFFILYSLFSESFPGVLATAATPLSKIIETLSLSTQGIFGIPLEVSANTVFLFVLFGALLEKAGGGKYFIDLAFSLLGGFRGGPAKASVLASGLTGMISGSSIANTVTTGTFTIPLMKRAGYPAVKAGAIEVAASTNGQLMPPIMGAAAFIIAETCNLPYAAVVKAAFLPATISYIALLYITHLEALKLDLKPIPRSELPHFRKTFIGGLHFLLPLITLLYLLIIERRSPRYAALVGILVLMAVVCLHALISEGRNGLRKALPIIGNGMVSGAKNMIAIGVAVAAAGIIVGVLSLGLSSQVTEVIRILSGGTLAGMLIVTAIVSLILGMGLPTTANYIVMASLTARAIEQLAGGFGLELPLIAIHLFVFYFGILSDDTPPVGLSAYAAAAISKADPIQTGIQGFLYDIRTGILPFMFLFNHRLLLIGVHSIGELLWVVTTALAGMFAFAAATQGFLRRKSHKWESALLLLSTWILFRPGSLNALYPLGDLVWSLVGLAIYAGVFFLQTPKKGLQL